MPLVTSLVKTAKDMVSKFGGDVTVRYVSAGTYNATAGTVTETTSDTDTKGILQDVNVREVNELIQAGDKRLIVAANDLPSAPETKDRVVISTVVHQIVRVVTEEQDNTAITYELILRV